MIFAMYSVKDELTQTFMQPIFIEKNDNAESQAIRQFKSNLNNIKLWKDNPSDFSLWYVGDFDDEHGADAVITEKIISGRSVLDVSNEDK